MGLADRFKKALGVREPGNPLELRRAAFREACARADEIGALELALAFSQDQQFDDALKAFAQLEISFPSKKGEWLRWQGQTLYISMSHRAANDAERIGCYLKALECYFQAARLGEKSQEFNVAELCEALCAEQGATASTKRDMCQRYLAWFPDGEGKKRVEELAAGLG